MNFFYLLLLLPGILELHIEDEIRVEGIIHSNGEDGGDSTAGGGAGGSILVFANHMDGQGSFEARGGKSYTKN